MDPDVEVIKRHLVDARIEVYRVRDDTVEVAERIRFHLMDSGIRVVARDPIEVRFTARSQRSGNPNLDKQSLFGLVRSAVSAPAGAQGFREADASRTTVTDPVDPERVLDVWYEITYVRTVADLVEAVNAVRWALSLERFIGRSAPPDGL